MRDRKIQSEAAKLANKKFRDYIKKKVVPREDAIQCAYNGINYFRARSAANEKVCCPISDANFFSTHAPRVSKNIPDMLP